MVNIVIPARRKYRETELGDMMKNGELNNMKNYTPLKINTKTGEIRNMKGQIIRGGSGIGGGRPSLFTQMTYERLRTAFLMGCNKEQAAAYAEISKQTLYSYINSNPDFAQEIEKWMQNPLIKAKSTIYNDLSNPDTAKWYLERKLKDEFSTRQEMTGTDGEPFILEVHPSLRYEPEKVQDAEEISVEELPEGKDNT